METAPPETPNLPTGERVGFYRVQRLLGTGGMGAVYEAEHCATGERVALKALHPEIARHPEAKERFVREAQIAMKVRHPHVAAVTDTGHAGGVHFLVMEYLEGETLADAIERGGALPNLYAVDLLLPVVWAVATLHDAGVIHRDLKPENIFLARRADGTLTPKVLDFGISKDAAHAHLTVTRQVLGTPRYMSPEQTRNSRLVDARSDQYALALMLYECLTGRPAFDGDDVYPVLHAIVQGDCPPLGALRPDLPELLVAAVMRAMAVDPAARFSDVRSFGRAIAPFASDEAREFCHAACGREPEHPPHHEVAPVASVTPTTPEARGASVVGAARSRGRIAAVVALALVGAIALIAWSRSPREAPSPPTPTQVTASALASDPPVNTSAPQALTESPARVLAPPAAALPARVAQRPAVRRATAATHPRPTVDHGTNHAPIVE